MALRYTDLNMPPTEEEKGNTPQKKKPAKSQKLKEADAKRAKAKKDKK